MSSFNLRASLASDRTMLGTQTPLGARPPSHDRLSKGVHNALVVWLSEGVHFSRASSGLALRDDPLNASVADDPPLLAPSVVKRLEGYLDLALFFGLI